MENSKHKEGAVTKAIENQTEKFPSDKYLIGAGVAIAISLTLKITGKKTRSAVCWPMGSTYPIIRCVKTNWLSN